MTSIPGLTRSTTTKGGLTWGSLARPVRGTTATAGGGHGRLLLPIAVVVAAVVVLAGWLLLVSPLRDDTAATDAQAASVTQQVDTLRSQLTTLQADQAKLPGYRADLQAAQAALPDTAALPAFLRTLQDLGTSTGTDVTGLDATAPDGTTVAAGNSGVGTVYQVPVTVVVTGTYPGVTAFVAALQDKQPRAVLVSSVSAADAEGGAITLTIGMTAFVAPTAGSTTSGG